MMIKGKYHPLQPMVVDLDPDNITDEINGVGVSLDSFHFTNTSPGVFKNL